MSDTHTMLSENLQYSSCLFCSARVSTPNSKFRDVAYLEKYRYSSCFLCSWMRSPSSFSSMRNAFGWREDKHCADWRCQSAHGFFG